MRYRPQGSQPVSATPLASVTMTTLPPTPVAPAGADKRVTVNSAPASASRVRLSRFTMRILPVISALAKLAWAVPPAVTVTLCSPGTDTRYPSGALFSRMVYTPGWRFSKRATPSAPVVCVAMTAFPPASSNTAPASGAPVEADVLVTAAAPRGISKVTVTDWSL